MEQELKELKIAYNNLVVVSKALEKEYIALQTQNGDLFKQYMRYVYLVKRIRGYIDETE